jgi:hypothetical protein
MLVNRSQIALSEEPIIMFILLSTVISKGGLVGSAKHPVLAGEALGLLAHSKLENRVPFKRRELNSYTNRASGAISKIL